MSEPTETIAQTSSMRRVARAGRQYGAGATPTATRHSAGRQSVARTVALEAAGPMIFLVILAIAAVGVTLGWLVTH